MLGAAEGNIATVGALLGLVELSEQMLAAAGRGEWALVAEIETHREVHLQSWVDPQRRGDLSAVRATLIQLIDLNERLTEAVARARAETAQSFQHLRGQRQAARSYQVAAELDMLG
jgi:hypothetical protein